MQVTAEIPECLDFLFSPSRYKVAYGGRGGAKSWAFADALLLSTIQKPTRVLCAREIQNSIKESVHKLLSDRIEALDLSGCFTITDASIRCSNGSEFIFKGLLRNVMEIKSLEGVDICWVEEAHNVSKESWDVLLPTIRKEGSEIWISFNTQYEDDETYKRFVADPPPNAVVRMINWQDNPYFPATLNEERLNCLARDPVGYPNIWEGKPKGLGGKVWPDFSDKVHVKEISWDVVKSRGNSFMAMDPAQNYYPACVWFSMIPKNENNDSFYKYIYAEWPTFDTFGTYFRDVRKTRPYNGTLSEMAREIYVKDGTAEHGIQILARHIDTRFAKGSGGGNIWSSKTDGIVAEFARPENGGLSFCQPAERIIDAQKDVIRQAMKYNTLLPIGPFNEPDLFVAPWCRNVIYTLQNHRLEDNSEQEREKDKDFSDALRIGFAGISGHTYIDPKPKAAKVARASAGAQGWMG